MDDIAIEHEVDGHRFVARAPEGDAELRYRYARSGALVLVHTGVPPSLEGHGLGARLVRTALEFARDAGLRVKPLCPFAARYIEEHPEYQPLVER